MKIITLAVKDELKIRASIAKTGLSLRDFSKKIGVSHGYLSQVLSNKSRPSPKVAKKISAGLNMEIDDIFLIKMVDKNIQNKNKVYL